jgi:hypothetical protein
MPDDKKRKRMVVEEVGAPAEAIKTEPVEEIKEKVEELQSITENISESVEKSAEVQEDLAKAAEEVVPKESQEMPEEQKESAMPVIKKRSGPNPLMIIIPGIFLLGALLGGIFFYQKQIAGSTLIPTPTPPDYTNTAATPTPAPTAQIDLTKYPVKVMNGSGIAGQAGVVKDLLTTAGFSVSGTSNAATYDFTKTIVKAKTDVPVAFLTQLTSALGKSYVLDTNQSLATSSADEVQVIVGSTKAQ